MIEKEVILAMKTYINTPETTIA